MKYGVRVREPMDQENVEIFFHAYGPHAVGVESWHFRPAVIEKHKEGSIIDWPAWLQLSRPDLDNLLEAFADLAWERGWRPKGLDAGAYLQQGRHLEDMRAIAFAKLKVEPPRGR